MADDPLRCCGVPGDRDHGRGDERHRQRSRREGLLHASLRTGERMALAAARAAHTQAEGGGMSHDLLTGLGYVRLTYKDLIA